MQEELDDAGSISAQMAFKAEFDLMKAALHAQLELPEPDLSIYDPTPDSEIPPSHE
jgi:hypothetical protein